MDISAERLRKIVEQGRSNVNQIELPSDEQVVVYDFKITKYITLRSKSNDYSLVKFTFLLTNEFESFEEEQVFSYNDNMYFSKRYKEFVQQFANFVELKDEIEFDDFINEKGTCHIIKVYQNLKVYRKIVIDSLEGCENESSN